MMNRFRHWLIVPALVALAACGTTTTTATKYPYPTQFVSTVDVGITVLGAPPAPGSDEYTKELDAIIARQAKLTDADKAVIMSEDHIQPNMILDPVLGKGYTKETHPALFKLLEHAASDAWRTGDEMQEYWNWQRPWVVDKRVQLLAKPITRPSYPSGHTTTNTVWAYVLSDLFPAKKDELLERASAIGYHRVDAGVHFPHDVEGGKRLAKVLYAEMRTKPQYKAELKAAQLELKSPVAAGGLPQGTVCTGAESRAQMTACH